LLFVGGLELEENEYNILFDLRKLNCELAVKN
jgi:hypothetical protein